MRYRPGLAVLGVVLSFSAGCTSVNPNYQPEETVDMAVTPPTDGPVNPVDTRRRDAAPPPKPDTVPWGCQSPGDCNDNLSCTNDVCNSKKVCEHSLKTGTCLIGGACFTDGSSNPNDGCQACLAAQSTTAWSPRSDGFACGSDNLACTKDVCAAGKCTHPLIDGHCLINSKCYTAGDLNPSGAACEKCDPASPGKWTSSVVTCFQDDDGDGFGDSSVSKTACSCGYGWSTKSGDCDDGNSFVFPGQTQWFQGSYTSPWGDESWDYNCNNLDDKQYSQLGYCYKSSGSCKWQMGWQLSPGLAVPDCGTTASYINGCSMSGGNCVASTLQQPQGCH
jgi:hypothetical protein